MPLLTGDTFNALATLDRTGFKAVKLQCCYPADGGDAALARAVEALCDRAEEAVRDGADILALSNRVGPGQVPMPSLLATAAVHNRLLRIGLRTKTDIVVECGDAVTPHDFATLVGYSASGIYPYLAHDTIRSLTDRGVLAVDAETGIANYNRAIVSGIVSIMSKMGISTMQGYHAAQVFEAVGLAESLVERYFTGTVSRIGGLDVNGVQRDCDERFACALQQRLSAAPDELPSSGLTCWRPRGEEHLITPQVIALLQKAVREDDYECFLRYSEAVHAPGRAVVLRDLLELVADRPSIPLEQVEPAADIVKRFNTGAMSYGSISQEAHECLAIAMNRLGGRSNSGEGGEDPQREAILPNGDSKRSAIKQIASGRFGVTSRYLRSATELQIKMAQGAKPGEGGHLPGGKVWPWIARTRQSTPGIGLHLAAAPPRHLLHRGSGRAHLRPEEREPLRARVGEAGSGGRGGHHRHRRGQGRRRQDRLISGSNGGTGAAPRDSIHHAGLPLEMGLAEAQQTLLQNGLRSRVVLEADGKLMDGRDVAVACLLGAEEFGFATMPLVALGCLMQRDCQKDTCPAGIATQNCALRARFTGKPEYVVNYMMFVAEQLRQIMAQLGFARLEDMVGQVQCLRQTRDVFSWKARQLDLSPLLAKPTVAFGRAIPYAHCPHFLEEAKAPNALRGVLDATLLIPYTAQARADLVPIRFHADIANVNRCVGTMLGSVVTSHHPGGLPDGSIRVDCTGLGGMSFGAFLPEGITLTIFGEANDYFGKGLSGGTVAVTPSPRANFRPEENIVVGNVAFYGATSGRGFVNGMAGQRFAVRNSGAELVVEGIGDEPRVHDRRHGAGAGRGGAELRGGHERRGGLRPGRARHAG